MSKYEVFSGLYFPVFSANTGKYGPEKTPYLNTFHEVKIQLSQDWTMKVTDTTMQYAIYETIVWYYLKMQNEKKISIYNLVSQTINDSFSLLKKELRP